MSYGDLFVVLFACLFEVREREEKKLAKTGTCPNHGLPEPQPFPRPSPHSPRAQHSGAERDATLAKDAARRAAGSGQQTGGSEVKDLGAASLPRTPVQEPDAPG